MESREEVGRFGRSFSQRCRDETIAWLDKVFEGSVQGDLADLHTALEEQAPEARDVAYDVARAFIDRALHNVLWMFDQEDWMDIVLTSEAGEVVSIKQGSDGLAGEVFTADGWYARFSRYGEI